MIIDCISDLHGFYPKLEGGDLLIVAGDLVKNDEPHEITKYKDWLCEYGPKYKRTISIAGNHDNWLQKGFLCTRYIEHMRKHKYAYLEDSGTEFEGLKIWGSPWTKTFEGMNPNCKAFTVDTDEELAVKFSLIPDDVDILITHGPPYGMCDYRPYTMEEKKANFSQGYGSESLAKRIDEIDRNGDGKKRLLICGHIHEGHGILSLSSREWDCCTWRVINASHVNEHYEPVNKPIRILL